jgi:fatty acid desaturase
MELERAYSRRKGEMTRHHDTGFEAVNSAELANSNSARGNDAVRVSVGPSPSRMHTSEYAELKQLISQRGLLDKQPAYYTYKILLTLGMLALGLIFLVVIDSLWLQLLNAAYLAFVFTQIGFIGHDFGHRQIFDGTRKNTIGSLIFTLFLGISGEMWVRTHNQHHANPNNIDLDPDIDIPVIAFTREEARRKQGIARFIVRYQAYFFLPVTCLLAFSQRIRSIQFLVHRQGKHTAAEALCMGIHLVLYFGLPLYSLTLWPAMLFVVIHQALHGVYTASVVSANHKGMPVLDKYSRLDFLRRQVLTARNVKAHPLTDFWYGGLNYQIEHHLFPKIARNKLREAQRTIKTFCQAHSLPYYESGLLQSYREIVQHLHQVSAPLREEKRGEWS